MNEPKSRVFRRTLFAGAGTLGALATVATLVPPQATPPTVPEAKPAPARGGGYQLTEHIQRYYRSTRV